MSKGIIKEKKPQKLSRLEVLKAWIAESIASIKRSLKDGGWKGTALGAATLTSAVGAGIVLVACVPTEVQIEKVTSESEVNRLVSANFSEEDAVRDEMTKQYGALSDFEYNNGKATANVERNGKSYAVSAEIDLGASDFEVTKYTNAELLGNNLTYTSEGQDVSENVSDKIVVEENGVIYVIDPSEALNTISIAVSDAILTENVDPENPGGEDKPDPDEPDPDEPENPGGEENPDPDKPGEGEEGKPDEGGEGGLDPEEPTEITFDSWQELMDVAGAQYTTQIEQQLAEIARDQIVTLDFVQWVVGSVSGRPATTLDNTKTLRIGYNFNENDEITSIVWTGVKVGHNTDTDAGMIVATVPLQNPISYNSIIVSQNLPENQKNENCITYGDITFDYTNYKNGMTYNKNAITLNFSRYGDEKLSDTNKAYFDLCMPLAVEAGLINADTNLAFCFVQGRSSTNAEWGSTYNVVIRFVDLNTNKYLNFSFVFDSDGSKDQVTLIENAISRGEYSVNEGEQIQITTANAIYVFEDTLNSISIYTIPTENQK